MIPNNVVSQVKVRIFIPDELKLSEKSLEALRNLRISHVSFKGCFTLGFRLNDGESCNSGKDNFDYNHEFYP